MRAKTVVLLVSTLAGAAGTAYVTHSWLDAQHLVRVAASGESPTQHVPMKATEVLVADVAIAAGTVLKREHLRWQAWPEGADVSNYFVKDTRTLDAVMGAVVRSGLSAGEPLTEGRVIRPGDRGFLAAMLRPGMRAVSVAINATTGISGFVFPGDRVDLLLTHVFEQRDSHSGLPRRATETVLDDLRVLAIDQQTDDQTGSPRLAKTVTLEVTPKQAEVLAVASDLGQLSLSLRSVAGSDGNEQMSVAEKSLTLDSHVSRLLVSKPTNGSNAGASVAVVRGGQVQELTFSDAAQR